jgi:hypothetical protein
VVEKQNKTKKKKLNEGHVETLIAKSLNTYTILIGRQWRLAAKISEGAAPDFCIFFIDWRMATDIKLKDYILYKHKERIKEKRTHYIICYG